MTLIIWFITLTFVEYIETTCDRVAFFNQKPKSDFDLNVTYADIYYVYGYSLIEEDSYSTAVNSTLHLRAIQERTEDAFLLYENHVNKDIQVSFQTVGFDYSSLKFDEYSTLSDSFNNSQYLIVIRSEAPESLVFLHTCKVMMRNKTTKSYNVRVLWVEGSDLKNSSEYQKMWAMKLNITKFNITGLKYYSDMCEQFVTVLDGCKVPTHTMNFYFALIVGVVAIFGFLVFTIVFEVVRGQNRRIHPAMEDEKY